MSLMVVSIYIAQILGAIICILLGYYIYDKRVNRNHGSEVPEGFEPTEEVNIDPVTGEKSRVYYSSSTGERFYKKEK